MLGCPAPRAARGPSSDRRVGAWLSLVEHLVRDQGVGGSNPLSPTILFPSESENYNTCPNKPNHSSPFGSIEHLLDILHRFARFCRNGVPKGNGISGARDGVAS